MAMEGGNDIRGGGGALDVTSVRGAEDRCDPGRSASALGNDRGA